MSMDINEIINRIPHRYPFILVDRVLELEPGISAKGFKNVSANEPYFQGHFPGYPIMPGVLIAEALAQLGAVTILSCEEYREKLALFAGIDRFRFRKQVMPGDRLDMEVKVNRVKGIIGKASVKALVDGEIAAEGEIMFALADRD